jgi:hypothetical protein
VSVELTRPLLLMSAMSTPIVAATALLKLPTESVRFVAVSKRFQLVGFRGSTIGMLECCELVPFDRFYGSELRVCPWVIDTSLPSITPLVSTSSRKFVPFTG